MTDKQSLDPLFARVNSRPRAEYLAEAVRCYNADAYRACIIMTCNAVFDAVRDRMEELTAGGVDKARFIDEEVKKKTGEGRSYEGAMISKLRENPTVLPAEEVDALDDLLKTRNNAAHPNGAIPRWKDAHYVFEKAVDYFLCENARPLKFLIDTLIADIYREGFFIDQDVARVAETVQDELEKFEPSERSRLVMALKTKVEDENSDVDSNSLTFLLGMLALERPDIDRCVYTQCFKKPGFSASKQIYLLDMCVIRPQLLSMLEPQNKARLDHTLAEICGVLKIGADRNVRCPTALLSAMVDHLGPTEACAAYPKTVEAISTRFWMAPELEHLFFGPMAESLKPALFKSAESGSSSIGRELVEFVTRADEDLAGMLSRGEVERLFKGLMRPEFDLAVRPLRDRKFSDLPNLRSVISEELPPFTTTRRFWRGQQYVRLVGGDLVALSQKGVSA